MISTLVFPFVGQVFCSEIFSLSLDFLSRSVGFCTKFHVLSGACCPVLCESRRCAFPFLPFISPTAGIAGDLHFPITTTSPSSPLTEMTKRVNENEPQALFGMPSEIFANEVCDVGP